MIKELQIELTNHCNSNCLMCPRSRLKRPLGSMSYDFAIKIIDQAVALGVMTIKVQWFGEPLLYPKILEVIGYCKKKNLKVILTTNGSLLSRGMANKLLSLKIDRINFSIDAGNRKNYEEIRHGLKFEVVKNNLEYIYKRKKEFGYQTIIQVDCLKNNGIDLLEVKNIFRNNCDRIIFNELQGNPANKGVCQHKVKERLVVAWNGKCYLCCHDWLGNYEIGDLNKDKMEYILNGKKRFEYISNLKNLDICQKCL